LGAQKTLDEVEKGVFFCMKDPSIAAAGSEGTVTYHVVVPNSNQFLPNG
jgi:hypothetical protein